MLFSFLLPVFVIKMIILALLLPRGGGGNGTYQRRNKRLALFYMSVRTKLDIRPNKVLFLGYGAVAKCVLSYISDFFEVDMTNIYVVDRCRDAIYGPNIANVNVFVEHINSCNFNNFINKIRLNDGDIIIDLTYASDTYYFTTICLQRGIHYMNTSIEDSNDRFLGKSIAVQHDTLIQICSSFTENNQVRSNVLIEFGQNPGLIQHYVLFALNELNKRQKNTIIDDYSKDAYIDTIKQYKIGSILMSEIDKMETSDPRTHECLHNTWSVSGLLSECLDNVELVVGNKNDFIKPKFHNTNNMLTTLCIDAREYDVIILNSNGVETVLDTICPDETNSFVNFKGNLIHHGEIFDLGRLFGVYSPFMSYVYKMNKHADEFIKQHKIMCFDETQIQITNDYSSFKVGDNINISQSNRWHGTDSIGCTIYCGEHNIEYIYWCGSVLSSTDTTDEFFTPTIIQVAAGVLSGLSYILEPENRNKGLLFPSDLDTKYILDKCTHLLGNFMFTEIPVSKFTGKW